MRFWVLAGLFSVVGMPLANAVETTADCKLDDTRRQFDHVIAETESGSAPPPAATAPSAQPAVRQAPPRRQTATVTAERQQQTQRRRNGKRIPDAQLIGPRGAL